MSRPGHGGAPAPEELIQGGKVMPVWDHLSELRGRLVKSVIAVVVFFALAFAFSERIIAKLQEPLIAVLPEGHKTLHFTGPLDVFMVDLKIAVLVGVLAACPVWLYQFWRFFEPALYPKERRFVLPFVLASTVAFALGIVFCYEVVLPLSLRFLMKIGMEAGTPVITIKDYVSLLSLFLLGFGAVFEAPVLLVLLSFLDLVSADALVKSRRFVVIGVLILAAVLTPPDPVSQIALAVPLYGMYELSILIIRMVERRRAPTPGA
jgi:sec-independent protein translocase protein TatC